MRKYLSIICAITMLACLGGCGSSDSDSDSKSSSETSSSSEKKETTEEKTDKETEKPTEKETEPETTKATEPATEPEKTDDSPVKILSHSLSKDYEGKDILVVEYSWTNTADKEKSFSFAVIDKAFQNGVQCDSMVIGCDEVDSEKQLADVMPGATITLKEGYHISDMTNVTIKVTDFLGDDTYINEVIDLGGGAGVSNDNSSSIGDTTLKITGHHLSTDYQGEQVLVIDYEFYNGEDDAESFIWFFSDKVFQNGVECDDLVIGCDDVDSQASMNEVMPGTTYQVSEAYHLTDTSDVTVKVTDLWGDTTYIDETFSIN